MKAKLYIILSAIFLLCSCSRNNDTLHLHCYALDIFDKKILNTPYDVYFNHKSLTVKDGKDTIYHILIDSLSSPETSSNSHGLTFERQKLYYTSLGKFVSDNRVCSTIFEKIMITDTDTIIGYEFQDTNWGHKHHFFKCKKPFTPEQYKEFIKFVQNE